MMKLPGRRIGMVNLPEIFGSMSFNEREMRKRLPNETYKALERTKKLGEPLDIHVANVVAAAMKDWAVEKGVTHYTHWFQPLNGVTAEKHDSFIMPDGDGGVIMGFSGKELIKGEADGSSFPSGGLRATFEARGYTAWDPTSYAFIKDGVLCIPTAFCSYGGHALDKKTPLLRSMAAVNTQAMRVLRLFGVQCGHVSPTVGLEQEYFIIDRERYNSRKDLIYTGRTLLGARPPKGQELDDHYYGSIKIRISAFMKEINEELWKLGILAKTEHNEVAPAQHEMAPIFTTTNVAVDHNQITMEIMRKVAKRHGLTCLLHEKPFEGLSGSGKHNNWSLSTDTGANLLEPGDTPAENAQFLTFFCAVIKAVDQYQDLLRISVSSAGNDHRLGGHEAPPPIVSMYVGEELAGILESIASDTPYNPVEKQFMKIGVDALPAIPKDTTDRNRTSPFAFTGNKFEFRMLGSSMSAADSNTVLNTIVADALCDFADQLEKADNFTEALHNLLKETISQHKRILFDGNSYDERWTQEAQARGLANYASTAEAVPHLMDDKNVAVFEKFGVLSRTELRAIHDIMLSNYCKQINIEARVMSEMVRGNIQGAVFKYARSLAEVITAKENVSLTLPHRAETELLETISRLSDELYTRQMALDLAIDEARQEEDLIRRAWAHKEKVLTAMDALRQTADSLELLVSKDYWPFPSYGKLLYRV
jgi:glutamine synthetase